MTSSQLREIARDPTLIPGIYETCDQWCAYCRATPHCLAFRCSPTALCTREHIPGERERDADPEQSLLESMLQSKILADAERRPAPPDVEAMLSGDRVRQRRVFDLDDPLERLGRRYMLLADAYLSARPDHPLRIVARRDGPTPLEVFAWFHVLAPARIFRALLSAREAAEGSEMREQEALSTAKSALVGVERSLDALAALAAEEDDPRLELMQMQLRELAPAIERRFPRVHEFARPGLDAPWTPSALVACKATSAQSREPHG
jgi:hypothetical protein